MVRRIFQGKHAKQVGTLAWLVTCLVVCGKVGVAALGRALRSRVAPKHRIKRVDRFLSNWKIRVDDWCEELFLAIVGTRRRVRIALDWTKVRQWNVLVASVVIGGRGVPFYFACYRDDQLRKSRNAFEEGFLVRLRAMIPKDVEAIIVADRGFRRVSMARALKNLGFSFVIRCCGDTWVEAESYRGPLAELPLRRGKVKDLGEASVCKTSPERVRVVAIWDYGQREPWYLLTNLHDNARRVVKYYGKRFTIEEVFRDKKSTRYGFGLKELLIKDRPDRMDTSYQI